MTEIFVDTANRAAMIWVNSALERKGIFPVVRGVWFSLPTTSFSFKTWENRHAHNNTYVVLRLWGPGAKRLAREFAKLTDGDSTPDF